MTIREFHKLNREMLDREQKPRMNEFGFDPGRHLREQREELERRDRFEAEQTYLRSLTWTNEQLDAYVVRVATVHTALELWRRRRGIA